MDVVFKLWGLLFTAELASYLSCFGSLTSLVSSPVSDCCIILLSQLFWLSFLTFSSHSQCIASEYIDDVWVITSINLCTPYTSLVWFSFWKREPNKFSYQHEESLSLNNLFIQLSSYIIKKCNWLPWCPFWRRTYQFLRHESLLSDRCWKNGDVGAMILKGCIPGILIDFVLNVPQPSACALLLYWQDFDVIFYYSTSTTFSNVHAKSNKNLLRD